MKEKIEVETYDCGFCKSIELTELTVLEISNDEQDWFEHKMLFLNKEKAKEMKECYEKQGNLTKIHKKTVWIN